MTNYIEEITDIANSPKIKEGIGQDFCKGHPIKKWMVIRVIVAHQLYLEKLKHEYTSDCCHAAVRVEGNVTRYHVCTKCHKPCNSWEAYRGH